MRFLLFFIIGFSLLLTGCSNDNAEPAENFSEYNTQILSSNNSSNNNSISNSSETQHVSKPVEEPMAAFSTKVSQKDPDRQTNITIACQSLNGTIVKAGETFSFCNALGPAKPEDGYKEADTFDADGNTVQAYGGGKCQVSSTLYNAVLSVPSLTVVERHAHSGPVYYVEEDKDACVSYGSCDFKFTNTNDFDIKMYFSNTPDSVDVSIVKLNNA